MHINDLLKIATDRGASDLHLKVGSHPVLRISGDLVALVDLKRLMQEDTIAMAFSIMNNRQNKNSKIIWKSILRTAYPASAVSVVTSSNSVEPWDWCCASFL